MMRIPSHCDRCEIDLKEHPEARCHTMSWWTAELICMSCKKEERELMEHPEVRKLKEGCGMSIEKIREMANS